MKLRRYSVMLAFVLLAPATYANGSVSPQAADPGAPGAQPPPKTNCSLPCMVMKVSTRCECQMRKMLPTVVAA